MDFLFYLFQHHNLYVHIDYLYVTKNVKQYPCDFSQRTVEQIHRIGHFAPSEIHIAMLLGSIMTCFIWQRGVRTNRSLPGLCSCK